MTKPDGAGDVIAERLASRRSDDAQKSQKKKKYGWWGRWTAGTWNLWIMWSFIYLGGWKSCSACKMVKTKSFDSVLYVWVCAPRKCLKQQVKKELQEAKQYEACFCMINKYSQKNTNPPSPFGQVRHKRKLQHVVCVTDCAPTTLMFWMTTHAPAYCTLSYAHASAYKQTISTCMLSLTQQISAGSKPNTECCFLFHMKVHFPVSILHRDSEKSSVLELRRVARVTEFDILRNPELVSALLLWWCLYWKKSNRQTNSLNHEDSTAVK